MKLRNYKRMKKQSLSVDILIFDHRYITDIKSHRSEYQKWENQCIEAHRQMQTVPKRFDKRQKR